MSEVVERLVATLEADIRGFHKGITDARRLFDREALAMERRQSTMNARINTGFSRSGTALNGLISRYASWGAAIIAVRRLVQEAIEVNEEAAASVARLDEQFSRLANNSAPAVGLVTDVMSALVDAINLAIERHSALWRQLSGGLPTSRTGGIPFASAATPFNSFDKKSGNWTMTGGGFPVSGVTDVTPAKGKEAKADTKADIEKQIAQDAFNTVQHFLELEVEAVRTAAQMEAEIRQHYLEVQQGLWESEAAELEDFHARANAAWDSYYERQAEMSEAAYEERLQHADTFFGSLATLTRSSSEELRSIGKAAAVIQATIDGVVAVQKALASAPPPINFALAAAVGAAAAANVAEIAGMEHGGRVQAGTPYIVGEKRAELFVPDRAGTIIPNVPSAMSPAGRGSGQMVINMPIDARGAQEGVADQIARAVGVQLKTIQRQFPSMMIRAQRDHL